MAEDCMSPLLQHFPEVTFAFAYGSGAVQQRGYDYTSSPEQLPMLDLIFVVEDPIQWHMENLKRNPNHYSCSFDVSWLVKMIQSPDSKGPALWFNVDVAMDSIGFPGRRMKYGVVSVCHLLEDLNEWCCLYIAGRLQKPLHIIKHNDKIMESVKLNREFAMKIAVLTLPKTFSETELFTTIAELSYLGDQRMMVGAENPNKINNLVLPQISNYRKVYEESLEKIISSGKLRHVQDEKKSIIFQNNSTRIEEGHFPSHLLSVIAAHIDMSSPISSNTVKKLADVPFYNRRNIIQGAIRKIVSKAAGRQTLVNLACVGVSKGVTYLLAKVAKGWKSSS